MSIKRQSLKDQWEEYTVVGIIGTRRRDSQEDYNKVLDVFSGVVIDHDLLSVPTIICSGGCPTGGDRFAEKIAKFYGLAILIHYPNWTKYKKIAGILRNTDIANDSDVLIACVAEDRTGGTEDTIKKFGDKGPLFLVY